MPPDDHPQPSIASIVDLYLKDLATRASREYFANTTLLLGRIVRTIGALTPLAVLRFRQELIAEGRSHRTANSYVKALSTCAEWARANGLLPSNPIDGIRSLPERERDLRKLRRAMSDLEIRMFLLASARLDRWRRHPMTPLFRTLIETGLRWHECVSLTGACIGDDVIVLPAALAKSGRSRVMPIRHGLCLELRRMAVNGSKIFKAPRGGDWAGNEGSALRIFYDTLIEAGIPRFDVHGRSLDIHALRYTCVSRMVRANVSEPIIQDYVGHANRMMTKRYTHLTADDARRELVKKMWRKRKRARKKK